MERRAIIQDSKNIPVVDENVKAKPKIVKLLWYLVKNRIRYPILKNKIGEFGPNVFFGYTDHPLDVDGTAFNSLFTVIRKIRSKKAASVLQVKYLERKENSFLFRAKGFNIYQIRDLENELAHQYKITGKTRFKELILQIDLLREDIYRLRLTAEKVVPENKTPMINEDITDRQLNVDFKELGDRYTITTQKITLEIYKEDFRIRVYDAQGNLITSSWLHQRQKKLAHLWG
ncbi:MAG: DUF4968 domain-containing protein [Deltaproteobacteria bacterium]|nr:DUF4968 domain-containing protein [Deltaproteobacteria bacterium]